MSLPPLANVLAIRDPDPGVHRAVAASAGAAGRDVWIPATGWSVVVSPFPGAAPDGGEIRAAGLAYVEGRDGVESWIGGGDHRDVAAKVDDDPASLDSLPGDVTLLRFRPDGGVTAMRACAGVAPVYVWADGARAIVATRLGDVVRFLPVEPRLDPLVNAMWACQHPQFPDERSFVAGVLVLDRGHALEIAPDGRRRRVGYWRPRVRQIARPSAARRRERAAEFRELLLDGLRRGTSAEHNLLALSGGVDSSAIAALVAGTLGRGLTTMTMYPSTPDLVERERSYIEPLVRTYAIRDLGFETDLHTRTALMRGSPPVITQAQDPIVSAIPVALEGSRVEVFLHGVFADEICGSGHTIPDWLDALPLRRLPVRGRSFGGRRDLLRWARRQLHRLVRTYHVPQFPDLDDAIHPDVRAEYRGWRRRIGRVAGADPFARRYLHLRALIDGWVQMHWEVLSHHGIRPCRPFFSREMLEFGYATHPDEQIGDGTKTLLRAAVVGDVPAHNLFRPDKGLWTPYLRAQEVPWELGPLPEAVAPIVAPRYVPEPPGRLPYIRAFRLEALHHIAAAVAHHRGRAS